MSQQFPYDGRALHPSEILVFSQSGQPRSILRVLREIPTAVVDTAVRMGRMSGSGPDLVLERQGYLERLPYKSLDSLLARDGGLDIVLRVLPLACPKPAASRGDAPPARPVLLGKLEPSPEG